MSVIRNPEFVDLQKSKVRFQLVSDDGVISTAELVVPKDQARGVNPYWDRILDEFDIEKMRKERNDKELRRINEARFAEKKKLTAIENNKLKELFDKKMKAFELPFVESASDTVKSAIRRAPDVFILNSIIHETLVKYMEEKNLDFSQLIDHLDDIQDAKLQAAEQEANATTEAPSEPTSP